MFKKNSAWYNKILAISLFILSLIIVGCSSPDSQNDNLQTQQQVEQKPTLTAHQIQTARQNYKVVVNDWKSTNWESHYNSNTDKTMSSFWTKLDLSVTNNNQDTSLDWLTIRVNIKHPPGSDGIGISWGRLPLDVNNIKPGETETMIVYYPGDLSQVTVMQEVYATIEKDISEDNSKFFKELKSAVTSKRNCNKFM